MKQASVTALARLREVLQQERAQEAALRASAESKVEQLQQQVHMLASVQSCPLRQYIPYILYLGLMSAAYYLP